MVGLYLYVEGGGDSKLLHSECRRGFREFLLKVGLNGRLPRIVACGGRQRAYDAFCTALRQATHDAMLLVDSEEPVTSQSPWTHLSQRHADQWPMPSGAGDDDCHLMVQCMETWFLADRWTIIAFFGAGFDAGQLPAEENPLEAVAKADVYSALQRATRRCKTKAGYRKGEHSFQLLARIDAQKVVTASGWAQRFIRTLSLRG